MKILGIETSCDESAASIVENGYKVLSNVIASQIDIHKETGGVVPEVASREHAIKIIPVIDECLLQAKVELDEIDAIAVTKGPGLMVCLLVGTNTASALAMAKNKTLIGVHHIEGHIYSNWLREIDISSDIEFPVLILTVSGGHNDLILMRNYSDFEIVGSTRDDAAGEAFDKVARILDLGYPGGPIISKKALDGDPKRYDLPRAWLEKDSLDFSFSGLKSAVLRLSESEGNNLNICDAAASFQEAACDVLSGKLIRASEKYSPKEIHLAGGVSANSRLREMISEKMEKNGMKIPFRHPEKIIHCTDNAAMIASAAYFRHKIDPQKYGTGPVLADLSFSM